LMADSPYYSRRTIEGMARCFLEGYGDSTETALVNLYTVKAMLFLLACQFEGSAGSGKLLRLQQHLAEWSLRHIQDYEKNIRPGLCQDDSAHKKNSSETIDVVAYRCGAAGLTDVDSYDAIRYTGPANEYKQTVMANAYRRLIGPLRGRRILDVGCGTGRGVVNFAPDAALAVGSDASLDMLSAARIKSKSLNHCALIAAYAQHLPFPDNAFDVVVSLNFLHLFNLKSQQEMIAEMKRVVRPGGTLVLEFDNALHGLGLGLYQRWTGKEQGALPGEIRRVLGDDCRVQEISGAVFPIVWRLFYHLPRLFAHFEKIAYFAPFNRLAHRNYYKVVKSSLP
jgi:ubiquinone/menaquinone biosynthesis C-methylase UbiE